MIKYILVVLSIAVGVTAQAQALKQAKAAEDLSGVQVKIIWVEDKDQLEEYADKYDSATQNDKKLRTKGGFAVLGKIDGEWTCYIYAEKPVNWKHQRALKTLGHELMHCYGYKH